MTDRRVLRATGAYGRDYMDGIGIAEDWLTGKDFKILGGAYFSIRDKEYLFDNGCREIHVIFPTTRHYSGWATKVIHLEEFGE
jgi:hypothetical protein